MARARRHGIRAPSDPAFASSRCCATSDRSKKTSKRKSNDVQSLQLIIARGLALLRSTSPPCPWRRAPTT
eukprot:2914786-Pyramimonas_sp.AAC.1